MSDKTIEDMIDAVKSAGYFVRKNPNRYDRRDMVQRLGRIEAGAMKIAAYRVRDPETDEWGSAQFHLTYDNTVLGVMGEQAARLFVTFVTTTLAEPPC